jgi:hypothetical protein
VFISVGRIDTEPDSSGVFRRTRRRGDNTIKKSDYALASKKFRFNFLGRFDVKMKITWGAGRLLERAERRKDESWMSSARHDTEFIGARLSLKL